MLHRLIGFVLVLASFCSAWAWMAYREFIESPLNIPPAGLVIEVVAGSSAATVAQQLASQAVLDNPRWLSWYARLDDKAHLIKAGEYKLKSGLTPQTLLGLLVAGRSVEHSLTLIEGWNFRQVRAAIETNSILEQQLTGLKDDEVMIRLGHPDEHPEGRFFPDTYLFPRRTTDVEFLQRAYARMADELQLAWDGRDDNLPLGTPYEALILASIVEKETGAAVERPEIAGVFARRLKRGMKLQTDPTVIYGMGERYDGNIRRSDLREDTPYNTYVRGGLPPTPICMPGRESLVAATRPANGKALYFVAKGDGSHVFSSTLSAHNAAVRKHQLKR